MESVYLETTFISYLVARPSRDLIVAGHQQITQEWWANRQKEFECRVSQVVVDEASVGDAAEVQKRLAIIGGLRALDVTADSWEISVMWEDPIVAEVDRVREMLAAKFNFDVEAIFADIRQRQAALGERLVPQRTRTEANAEADRGHHPGSPESTSADAAPAG
jgi:hypothetical protein